MLANKPAGDSEVFLVLQVIVIWVLVKFGTQTYISGMFIKSSSLQPFRNMFCNQIYSGNDEQLSSNSSGWSVQMLGNWNMVQLDETNFVDPF